MNRSEKIQNEVTRIINDYRDSNPRAARSQYPASKKNIAKLEELGLIEFMPKAPYSQTIGQTEANIIIAEAAKAPGAVMNAYGEGEETGGSDLWQALNETDKETAPEDEEINLDTTEQYEKALNASLNAPRLRLFVRDGVVVKEFVWQPLGNYRSSGAPWGYIGQTVEDIKKAGFERAYS